MASAGNYAVVLDIEKTVSDTEGVVVANPATRTVPNTGMVYIVSDPILRIILLDRKGFEERKVRASI